MSNAAFRVQMDNFWMSVGEPVLPTDPFIDCTAKQPVILTCGC